MALEAAPLSRRLNERQKKSGGARTARTVRSVRRRDFLFASHCRSATLGSALAKAKPA
jgi:hypothetical protein